MTTYEQAKRYVKMGWSVIPIRPDGSKAPALKSWKEYQLRYPTDEELRNWFINTTNGIGIVTGEISRLSVVDVDTKDTLKGIASSICVLTKKGKHYYFRYEEQLKNWVKPTDGCWDIRTKGGYCVAPSTPNYRWVNPYFSVNQLPNFPLHLLPKETKDGGTNGKNEPDWIMTVLSNMQHGNMDATWTRICGAYEQKGFTEETAYALLLPHIEKAKLIWPPANEEFLREKIRHVWSSYRKTTVPVETRDSDSLSEFMQDSKPITWICEPIIGEGTIGFCAGLPETFKTWLMADLAIEVARGGMWLGKYKVKQGTVLFIDQERYKSEVQRRFKLLMNDKGIDWKDLEGKLILKSQTTTRIDLDDSYSAFRRRLTDIRPSLIVIDSFATFHTKEENNRRDIQVVLERLKQLRTEFGCTILLIDHENKSVFDKEDVGATPNAFKMVGSVGKPAAAETVLTVRKTSENEVILYHTKSTLSPTVEPMKLTVRDTEKGVRIE